MDEGNGTREVIRLWPDGVPGDLGDVPDECALVTPNGIAAGTTMLRNITDPRLEVFAPAPGTSNGAGVVVVPGGGWTINMWGHEGTAAAEWLTGLGYTAFVLAYRVQATPANPAAFAALAARMDAVHAAPLPAAAKPRVMGDLATGRRYEAARTACADDGRRALEVARAHAGPLGVDPATIGMVGFSAGAFLVVDVALDPRGTPPRFVGAVYGGEVAGASVPDDAPPLFTVVADDDILAEIVKGLGADWSAAGRPTELHLFAEGGHGFGLVGQGLPCDGWTSLFEAWLARVTDRA